MSDKPDSVVRVDVRVRVVFGDDVDMNVDDVVRMFSESLNEAIAKRWPPSTEQGSPTAHDDTR
jgi:hypothetical protein